MQHYAAAAEASAARPLTAISRIGRAGFRAQNALRDLVRQCQRASCLNIKPAFVKVPIKERRCRDIREVNFPVIAPHELFAALHRVGKLQEVLVGTGGVPPERFWQEASTELWAAEHPAFPRVPRQAAFTIPIRIHGDEGTGHKKKESW